ncbi:MAG: hypothetical protein QNJ36_10625 [Calothrix sp. MO_167.B42]|nr:hypothetical protein [Calothrix sp. MO_167.B42]
MFTKSQVFGLLAAVIAIAPSTAIAQSAPNPDNQQNQTSEIQTTVNQVPTVRKKKSNILPGVAGTVLNGITGGKNIVPGVAGEVVNGILNGKKNIAPENVVNSVTNQQQNTATDNVPQAQQESDSIPTTHLCNAKAGVDMSVQNLNPLNVVSGVTDIATGILGGKKESPNKLQINGGLGCLPR